MFEKFDETKRAQEMETCAMSDYMGLVLSKKLISICGKSVVPSFQCSFQIRSMAIA